MATKGREAWFTDIVTAALGESIMEADDVTKHATPDVLAESLPPALLSKVLAAALDSGSMTPKVILETLSPALLSAHVPHPVLWESVEMVAKRAGLADANEGGNGVGDARRRFLQAVIESGLSNSCVSVEDVLAHATPDVLANHLPAVLKAKMLTAGLAANALNPQLIVDTLGVEDMSTHLPISVLWACGQQAGKRSLGDADAADVEAALDKALDPKPVAKAADPKPADKAADAKPAEKAAGSNVEKAADAKPADKAAASDRASSKSDADAKAKGPRPKLSSKSKSKSKSTKSKVEARPEQSSAREPQSFDEDTGVREANWVADEDFEVLEEADAVVAGDILSSSDWTGEEKTDAGANLS